MKSNNPPLYSDDIEDLHERALLSKSKTYEDPATGFNVFTELFHLKRGKCCGNKCRHCPYGWENVDAPYLKLNHNGQSSRPAKAKSEDQASIQLRLQEIEEAAAAAANSEANDTLTTTTTNRRRRSNNNSSNNKKRVGGTHGGRLTDKNVPYTKKGDAGSSQLLTGEKRSKNNQAFEAMGTVDELCSVVGVAHALLLERLQASSSSSSSVVDYGDLPEWLLQVMSRLFDAGSHVAKPVRLPEKQDDEEEDHAAAAARFQADGIGGGLDIQHVEALEDWIDTMTEPLPELRNFILPTGSMTAAQFHVCRTVCRRAERQVVPLVQEGVCDPNVLKYLNRLSDFLFVAARWCNYCQGTSEIEYRKAERRDKQRVAKVRDEWNNK